MAVNKTTTKQTAPTAEASAKPAVKKTASLNVDVYDLSGKAAGKVSLPSEIFGVSVNKQAMAQAVRVYLANQREGSANTKTRGQVRGSTRKIYRQKGTGRARHGGVRAPIFVHGGVAHGPKVQDHSLQMPQKMRRLALFSALTAKLQEGEVALISGLAGISPKTKEMARVLTQLSLDGKKRRVLLVTHNDLENVSRATKNLPGVRFTAASRLNTYEVLNTTKLVLMQESIDALKTHFLGGKKA